MIKVTQYASLSDIKNEGLRDEAEAWASDGDVIVAGRAVQDPDDGSGPMEGFFNETDGQGMVAWGEDAEVSDWIECSDLKDLFKKYLS